MSYCKYGSLRALALSLALGLAGVLVAGHGLAQPADPSARERIKLLIKGMDADEAMADRAKMVLTLRDFDVQPPAGSLKQWINDIEASDSPLLNGLGAAPAHALLFLAANSVHTGHGGFVNRPGVETYGQIQATCESEDGPVDGYKRNADGSGHLCVTMFTKKTRGHGPEKEMALKLLVMVGVDGFHVEEKDLTFANNVFPDFAQASGLSIGSEMATGFNFKLWASGTTISVARAWIDEGDGFVEIDPESNPEHEKYAGLFEVDEDACIDMMFVGDPPFDYDELGSPPYYCLGRCANPPLINTK